jgi:hypothetical protein
MIGFIIKPYTNRNTHSKAEAIGEINRYRDKLHCTGLINTGF